MSVFVKLLVSMLVCTVVPIVLLLFVVTWVHGEQTRKHVLEHLRSVAALQKNRVADVRQHSLESLALLYSRTQLRLSLRQFLESADTTSQDKMNRILRDARNAVEKFQQIDVVSTDGRIVASTNDARIGTSPYSPDFLRHSLEHDTAGSIIHNSERRPLLRSAGPLRLDGEVIGAIVADSQLSSLAAAIHDYSGLGETGETLLAVQTADEPKSVFPARFDDLTQKSPRNELLRAALSSDGRVLPDAKDYRGRPVIAVSQRIDETGWALIVKMDEDEENDDIGRGDCRGFVDRCGLRDFAFAGRAALPLGDGQPSDSAGRLGMPFFRRPAHR